MREDDGMIDCPSCGHAFKPEVGGAYHALNIEHLGQVAEVYNAKVWTGKPTSHVIAAFNVPRSTAHRWVRKARELGLIEPRQRARPNGTRPPIRANDNDVV